MIEACLVPCAVEQARLAVAVTLELFAAVVEQGDLTMPAVGEHPSLVVTGNRFQFSGEQEMALGFGQQREIERRGFQRARFRRSHTEIVDSSYKPVRVRLAEGGGCDG